MPNQNPDGVHAQLSVRRRDFVTPMLIGGPYTSMIGKLIQLQFGFHVNAAMVSAMAFSVIAICLVAVLFVALILRLTLRVR
jgi:ABC-type spermidine/putrescine transport system permease subunit I